MTPPALHTPRALPQLPGNGRRVVLETLGCKLNQYETDAIATELQRRGYTVYNDQDVADVYVVNSCTVTNKADRKSRSTVNRASRRANNRGIVVLTGCFVDSHAGAIDPGTAHYVVDNEHKNAIPDLIDAHFRGETVDPNSYDPNVFGYAPPSQVFHTRTNIKIQDGCDNFCTFCIIPFVRGRARSRHPEEIMDEAREAIRGGAREIVLTGVNMSRYAAESGATFTGLVRGLLELPGEYRLRISSLEPDTLDEQFCEVFAHPRMCQHLHLCLQSGSDRILLGMRRMYTVRQYMEVVTQLRAVNPRFTITTDLIVGFPGETDADFADSLAILEEAQISHVHMFPYSVRAGTRAERMPNHVGAQVRNARAQEVQRSAAARKRRIRESQVGSRQTVLVERIHGATGRADSGPVTARGLTEYYHPTILRGREGDVVSNSFVEVEIVGIEDAGRDEPTLLGRPCR